MKLKKSKEEIEQDKEKISKIKDKKPFSIRNRNIKNPFQGYLKPNLKNKIKSIEDAHWMIMHGNNYRLFKKIQDRKKLINYVVLFTVSFTLIALVVAAIVVAAVMFKTRISTDSTSNFFEFTQKFTITTRKSTTKSTTPKKNTTALTTANGTTTAKQSLNYYSY